MSLASSAARLAGILAVAIVGSSCIRQPDEVLAQPEAERSPPPQQDSSPPEAEPSDPAGNR